MILILKKKLKNVLALTGNRTRGKRMATIYFTTKPPKHDCESKVQYIMFKLLSSENFSNNKSCATQVSRSGLTRQERVHDSGLRNEVQAMKYFDLWK
jgi:hypothetical protein